MRTLLFVLALSLSVSAVAQTPPFGGNAGVLQPGGTPGGAAGGDLSGTYPNPKVSAATASDGFSVLNGLTASSGTFTATGNSQFGVKISSGMDIGQCIFFRKTGKWQCDAASASGGSSQWSGTAGGPIYYDQGFVGIGNNSPSAELDVQNLASPANFVMTVSSADTTHNSFNIYGNGHVAIGADNSGGVYTLEVTGTVFATTMLYSNKLMLDTFGIWTNSGRSDLILNSTGGEVASIQNDDANSWSLAHGDNVNGLLNTPVLSWTTDGNVGIGTIHPATELHLSSGTLLIDGNVSPAIKITGAGAPPDSQALCLLNGAMGHCTSVVGAGGGCTCSVP